MSAPGLRFQLIGGVQAASCEDELLALHDEVYGQAPDPRSGFARQLRVWRRQPGFVLAEARNGGYLVGYACGMPLRPSTSWWSELTTSLPPETVAERPGRTFALTELLVRAAWRRQGIARALHDLVLSGRQEERATVTVPPGASAAQHAFRSLGWHKVARTRGAGADAPLLDVLVMALPAARALDWPARRLREGCAMPIVGLGHTGLWVTDLAAMRDFYERVIGLTVTDADDEQGIVFFSSRPDEEHHEFVLQRGRTAPPGSMLPHQISWRVDSVETLQMYHHRFKAEGVPVQQEVTHGNAYGIYFFDPEGNRGEVYLRIPRDVRQPFRKSLNLEQSVEDVDAEAERLLADDGPRYQPVTWQPFDLSVAVDDEGMLSAMDADYPEHLLAREPAPPYEGEGAFHLWHFSEDPSLGRFQPRASAANREAPSLVWAVDTRHAPMFWFPRDCPRGCIWPVSATTREDRELFFGQSAASRIHVMENGWLRRMRECRLYAYRLPAAPFRPHEVGGYWIADEPVDAVEQLVIDDLAGRHASAGIELRITPSIWPFWRRVANSTVGFSGSRLRNSGPHPDRFS